MYRLTNKKTNEIFIFRNLNELELFRDSFYRYSMIEIKTKNGYKIIENIIL
jgi:hypothetical protein